VSYAQGRRVWRNGERVWLPERDVRVIWLSGKIKIWRDDQRWRSDTRVVWRMRCDCCIVEYKVVMSTTQTWSDAWGSAARHARLYHNVTL